MPRRPDPLSLAVPPRPATGEGHLELVVHESLDDVLRGWERLAERTAAPPFLRHGWFEAWVEAFEPAGFRVVAAHRDGEIAGVLPVVAGRGSLASASNQHTPLFEPLADDQETLRELVGGSLALRRGGLDLAYLPRDGGTAALLRTLAAERRLRVIERETANQPFVDTSGSWDAYQASLARKLRKEVGRLRRRLEEQGDLTLTLDASDAAALDDGLRIEGSGWKADRGSAILSCPPTERFYRRIAAWAAERGWLRLALLRLDGRAIAFDLCLEAHGVVYALKGGFDHELRRFGPGTLLTYESLAAAFAGDARAYEFLGNDEAYKLVWTQATRPLVRFQAFAATPAGAARYVGLRHLRPAVKRVAIGAGLVGASDGADQLSSAVPS